MRVSKTLLSILAGVASALTWVAWKRGPTTHGDTFVPPGPVSSERRSALARRSLERDRRPLPPALAEADPVAVLLGRPVPGLAPQTRARLEQAYNQAEYVQRTADVLRRDSLRDQVTGLQKVLFCEDWVVASYEDPALACDEALPAYERLVDYFDSGHPRPRVPSNRSYESLSESEGLHRMRQNYLRLLNSHIQGYSNVLTALSEWVPADQALDSPLFADACGYSICAQMFREWEKLDRDTLGMINHELRALAGEPPTPESVARESQGIEEASERTTGYLRRVYRDIYARRFSEYYGLDGDAITARLETVPITNSGQEVLPKCW